VRRRDLPGLDAGSTATLDDVREHLRRWRMETLEAVDLLHAHRARVDASYSRLENPNAVIEYLDAFIALFTRIGAELAGIDAALAAGAAAEQCAALRHIAEDASSEQRRCVTFRDKCINKPLPYEDVRPLLNQISIDTRDQLLDLQEVHLAAARLEALTSGPGEPEGADRGLDRRSLFTRFIPKIKL
jgi:hypothetical protein